jgi:hypothetical protein
MVLPKVWESSTAYEVLINFWTDVLGTNHTYCAILAARVAALWDFATTVRPGGSWSRLGWTVQARHAPPPEQEEIRPRRSQLGLY